MQMFVLFGHFQARNAHYVLRKTRISTGSLFEKIQKASTLVKVDELTGISPGKLRPRLLYSHGSASSGSCDLHSKLPSQDLGSC